MLIPLVSRLINQNKIILGSQDCHYIDEGAYTGDTNKIVEREQLQICYNWSF